MPGSSIATRTAAALFAFGAKTRSFGYDTGLLKASRVEGITVISVGNLAVGGSGKTPFSAFLAKKLKASGKRVAVILRGYKGSLEISGGVASLGEGPILSVKESGDEAYLLAEELRHIPIYLGADRIRSVIRARDDGAEVAVLDDGFSHRRLHRDLDILLASRKDLGKSAAFFPLGDLRESQKAAARAHLVGGFEEDWREGKVDFTFRHVPIELDEVGGGIRPLSGMGGERAFLLCGIAKPERFIETARRAGFDVCGHLFFKDHHRFSKGDLSRVFSNASAAKAKLVLTTSKDRVRIPTAVNPLPLYALRIETQLVTGCNLLDDALGRLF